MSVSPGAGRARPMSRAASVLLVAAVLVITALTVIIYPPRVCATDGRFCTVGYIRSTDPVTGKVVELPIVEVPAAPDSSDVGPADQ